MGKIYEAIDERLATFIKRQKVFFVASAPLAPQGHVNCSPKGGDCFRIIGPNTVVYEDYVGSGAETIAHVRENGRIVIMFMALSGQPKILRLHGSAQVLLPGDEAYENFAALFDTACASRSMIKVDVTRIQDSCGFGVPEYVFEKDREALPRWANSKTPEEIADYKRTRNAVSIDDLPALED